MHTVAANCYISYRSLRGRLADIWPPDLDPLCALIVRLLWINGSELVSDDIRAQFALPRSTLSSALGRLDKRGYIQRYRNVVDARFVLVMLTAAGRSVGPAVTVLIDELESDILEASDDESFHGFDRVATLLAAMDEEG